MLLRLGDLASITSEIGFLLDESTEETPDPSGTSRIEEEKPDPDCTIKKDDGNDETPLTSNPRAPPRPQNETYEYNKTSFSPERRVKGLRGLLSLLNVSGMTKDVSALSTQDLEDILSKFDREKSSTGGPYFTVTSSGPNEEVYTLVNRQRDPMLSESSQGPIETIQSQCIDMMRDALDRALLEDLLRHSGTMEGMTREEISVAASGILSRAKASIPTAQGYLSQRAGGVVSGGSQ